MSPESMTVFMPNAFACVDSVPITSSASNPSASIRVMPSFSTLPQPELETLVKYVSTLHELGPLDRDGVSAYLFATQETQPDNIADAIEPGPKT